MAHDAEADQLEERLSTTLQRWDKLRSTLRGKRSGPAKASSPEQRGKSSASAGADRPPRSTSKRGPFLEMFRSGSSGGGDDVPPLSHQSWNPSLEAARSTPQRAQYKLSEDDLPQRSSMSPVVTRDSEWVPSRRSSAPEMDLLRNSSWRPDDTDKRLAKDLLRHRETAEAGESSGARTHANELMIQLLDQLSTRAQSSADGQSQITKTEVDFLRRTFHTTMTDRRILLMESASERLNVQIKEIEELMHMQMGQEDEQALRMICENEDKDQHADDAIADQPPPGAEPGDAAEPGHRSAPGTPVAVTAAEQTAIMRLFEAFDTWNFDTFAYAEQSPTAPLVFVGFSLFHHSKLSQAFRFEDAKLLAFLAKLDANYPDNPFHSSLHGCDVAQTMNYMLTQTGLRDHVCRWHHLAGLIAALAHDVGHIGLTNQYLKETHHELALTYSYVSPLENMHVSRLFGILAQPDSNFLDLLSRSRLLELRSMIISMVLATDMAYHGLHLMELEQLIASEVEDLSDPSAASLVMKIALHCSDISNPAKDWNLYTKWTDRVLAEFVAQGDLERSKGMAISPGFDREKITNAKQKASGQLFFIGVLVQPYFTTFCKLSMVQLPEAIQCLERNQATWKTVIEEHDNDQAPTVVVSLPDSVPQPLLFRDEDLTVAALKSQVDQRQQVFMANIEPIVSSVVDAPCQIGGPSQDEVAQQSVSDACEIAPPRQAQCMDVLARLVHRAADAEGATSASASEA